MKRIAMLLVAAGVAAQASAHEGGARGNAPVGCSAITVTAPGLRKQPRDLRFSTRAVLDLEFQTRLERAYHGDHVLQFKVFTPSGFLYQELSVPFAWPTPGRSRSRGQLEPASYPGPPGARVQVVGEAASSWSLRRAELAARLPVSGTSITMSTLYGRWSVQAFLDGKARPCSPVRYFTIHSK
jgi:hypothetical protein